VSKTSALVAFRDLKQQKTICAVMQRCAITQQRVIAHKNKKALIGATEAV
jgi:hypothetical protein